MALFERRSKDIDNLRKEMELRIERMELDKAKQVFEVEQRMVNVSESKVLEKAKEIHTAWIEEVNKANNDKDKKRQEELDPKSLFIDPFQLLESMGYRERPMMLGYDQLRLMSERNPVIAAVINTRVNQIASFARPPRSDYDVGFKFIMRDSEAKATTQDKKRMKELSAFTENTGFPGKVAEETRDNFEVFLRKTARDSLTYDQMCYEIVPSVKGVPGAYYAVDASTIRLATTSQYWKDRQKLGGYTDRDVVDAKNKEQFRLFNVWGQAVDPKTDPEDVRYVQLLMGRVINTYTEQEFCFGIRNPRTSVKLNGYGVSELEILVNTVVAHMWAEEHNRRFFSQGSAPKGIIHFEGANINQEHLNAFRRQWHAQIAGVYNAWRTPIIASPAKLMYTNLQVNNRQMEFTNWIEYLVKIICSVYLIDPAEINFDFKGGIGHSEKPLFESQNEAKQKMSKDRGLRPLLKFIESEYNKNVIFQIEPLYEFQFIGLDAKTEEAAQKLRIEQLQNYRTIDEIRVESDLPKMGPEKGGDIILNNTYTQYMLQLKMQQQQEAMGGGFPGEEGGGFPGEGQPGEEPQYDFGQEEPDFGEETAPAGGGAKPKQAGKPTAVAGQEESASELSPKR